MDQKLLEKVMNQVKAELVQRLHRLHRNQPDSRS